jgi:predicted CXXCH cytochrome family protein
MHSKGDISAPTCNDCHGNHGALPPSVGSVANACGTCHGKVAKLFAQTRMKHKFEEVGVIGCAVCHGTHQTFNPGDAMISASEGALCSRCHNPENPRYGATIAGAHVAKRIRAKLDELKSNIEIANSKVRQAELLGMEVRGSRYDLHQAFDALTNARTQVHTFSPGPIDDAVDAGLKVTAAVQESADAALREHANRRLWLAGSLIPILIVVALLLIVIRRMPFPETTYDHPPD